MHELNFTSRHFRAQPYFEQEYTSIFEYLASFYEPLHLIRYL